MVFQRRFDRSAVSVGEVASALGQGVERDPHRLDRLPHRERIPSLDRAQRVEEGCHGVVTPIDVSTGTPGKIRTYDIRLRRPTDRAVSSTKSRGVTAP